MQGIAPAAAAAGQHCGVVVITTMGQARPLATEGTDAAQVLGSFFTLQSGRRGRAKRPELRQAWDLHVGLTPRATTPWAPQHQLSGRCSSPALLCPITSDGHSCIASCWGSLGGPWWQSNAQCGRMVRAPEPASPGQLLLSKGGRPCPANTGSSLKGWHSTQQQPSPTPPLLGERASACLRPPHACGGPGAAQPGQGAKPAGSGNAVAAHTHSSDMP